MSALKPYPAYKDSGFEWLGEVPEHWRVMRLARGARIHNGADSSSVEVADGGYPVYGSGGEFRRASEYLFEGDSVLFGRKGTVDRPILVSGKFWTVDTMFYSEIDRKIWLPGYLYYWAATFPYGLWSTSTALPSMTSAALLSAAVPTPDEGEQRAIADFLDRETAEIDAFVAESEKLITLLNERRAAVIAQAVTKGLDPTVAMKDTGIEWLGEIPAHWSAPEIRRYYALQIGKMLNETKFSGEPAPYVRAGNIQDYGLDLSEVKMLPVTDAEKTSLAIRSGDVLFVEGGAGYGRSDYVEENLEGWVFQNHVIRIRPLTGAPVNGAYLDFWLRFLRAQGHYEALSAFATIPNVSADKLGQIEMTLPPREEQEAIVSYISAQTAKIDEAIATAREAIALAKERRQALISAAVTGKIDVRSVA